MFEHVGLSQLEIYFEGLLQLLRPEGRLLNHGISRAPGYRGRAAPVGARASSTPTCSPTASCTRSAPSCSTIQERGFEVRHVESLREHYPLTLRAWLANLEANWTEAVALVGEPRARVWRLYVAASAARFEDNAVQVHQVLAVKPRRRRERHAAPPDLH